MRTIVYTLAITVFLAGSPLSYAKNGKEKGLPPGLQKKAARGEALPPGWQKKLARGEVLDPKVYKQGKVVVPADPRGIITIRIDDRLLKIHKDTRKIIDILK